MTDAAMPEIIDDEVLIRVVVELGKNVQELPFEQGQLVSFIS